MHGHDCHFQSVARKSRQSRTRRPVPITTVTLNAKPLPFWAAPRTDFRPAELAIQKSTATAGPAVQVVAECVGQSADHVGRGPRRTTESALDCRNVSHRHAAMGTAQGCRAVRGTSRCAAFRLQRKNDGAPPEFSACAPREQVTGAPRQRLHRETSTGCSVVIEQHCNIAASSTNFWHPIIFACDPAARL